MIAFDGEAIVFREEPLPLWLRAFTLFLGSGLAFVGSTPFMVHPDWTDFSPVLIVAALFIVVMIAAGAFFIVIGLFSATDLRLDPVTGHADRYLRGPIVNRHDRFPLSRVAPPDLIMRDSEDGPYPILKLKLPRGRVEMACFDNEAEARAWCARIEGVLTRS